MSPFTRLLAAATVVAVLVIAESDELHAQSLLWKFEGDSANDTFGLGVAGVGDVDGDGRAAVAIGAFLDDPNGTD